MAEPRYTKEFANALRHHSNAKKSAKKKIEAMLGNPLGFGEPLKYELEGLSSFPVKRNFICIYVYCRECRLKGYTAINACSDCQDTPDEVVKFLTFGPHDEAYRLARKIELG